MFKRKKGLLRVAAGLLALTLGLAACDAGSDNKGGNEDEIVIGAIQDLSGNSSVSGLAMDRGAQVAIDKINEDGGIGGSSS